MSSSHCPIFEPNLHVTVGSKALQTFLHNALFLCQESNYIDATMIHWKGGLRFAHIEVWQWELMIKFLEPDDSFAMTPQRIQTILPLYVKYQFHRAIEMCDRMLNIAMTPRGYFKYDGSWSDSENRALEYVSSPSIFRTVKLAAQLSLQYRLHRSISRAMDFISLFIRDMMFISPKHTFVDKADLKVLFQLLRHEDNDDSLLVMAGAVSIWKNEFIPPSATKKQRATFCSGLLCR
jgi:hypothetical protein